MVFLFCIQYCWWKVYLSPSALYFHHFPALFLFSTGYKVRLMASISAGNCSLTPYLVPLRTFGAARRTRSLPLNRWNLAIIVWGLIGHFYAPPPESGGVLCYTLRKFECPSVRTSVCLSVCPSVHPSVSAHHHSCIGNSSYSFRPILLKLYRCFKDGLKICILFFQNPEIIFYHIFRIFNLDIFWALILQICIWSMYLVSATPPTVFGQSFWNFTGVLRMVWRYAYCFFRILKLFFITFYAFLT